MLYMLCGYVRQLMVFKRRQTTLLFAAAGRGACDSDVVSHQVKTTLINHFTTISWRVMTTPSAAIGAICSMP